MAMGYVGYVGEIEEVVVVAELEAGLAVVVRAKEAGRLLDVTWTEYAAGADGACQEFRERRGSVRC